MGKMEAIIATDMNIGLYIYYIQENSDRVSQSLNVLSYNNVIFPAEFFDDLGIVDLPLLEDIKKDMKVFL